MTERGKVEVTAGEAHGEYGRMNWDTPINPIGNIQRPIRSKCSQIMCGDRLSLAGPLQHEELREDSDRLEEDGEGP